MIHAESSGRSKTIFWSVGESSGDLHAAHIIQAFKKNYPSVNHVGMAGPKMRALHVDALVDAEQLSVMGLIEVLLHWRVILNAYRRVKAYLIANKPNLIVLVDYPGFNLKLAKLAKQLNIPVLYYISPKIWAWKKNRIHTIKAYVDHMAVIFPFEMDIYQQAGVPVSYVGCPLLDELPLSMSQVEARQQLSIDADATVLSLLPGSRVSEINRLLPLLLNVAHLLQKKHPAMIFFLPIANTIKKTLIEKYIQQYPKLNLRFVNDDAPIVLKASNAALCASGTVTLQAALLETPMAIVYKLNEITYQIAKRVVKIPYIGLCNIVAQNQIAKEFIQSEANVENLFSEMEKLLFEKAYSEEKRTLMKALKTSLSDVKQVKPVEKLIAHLINLD